MHHTQFDRKVLFHKNRQMGVYRKHYCSKAKSKRARVRLAHAPRALIEINKRKECGVDGGGGSTQKQIQQTYMKSMCNVLKE